LTPQAATGLIQVGFDILSTLFIRAQLFYIILPSLTPRPLPLPLPSLKGDMDKNIATSNLFSPISVNQSVVELNHPLIA